MPTPEVKRKSAAHGADAINQTNTRRPVVLITGASSGFGEACAQHLSVEGYRVFGTSRRVCFDPPDGAPPQDTSLSMIPMDVRDTASVQAGVEFVLANARRIDAVVCNAGFGMAGSVEDTTVEEAQRQFDTNFFGTWRVCRAVLPHLRRQGGGYLVIVGSLAGRVSVPFQAAYSASKFALEGLAEGLRMEVKPWGIHVVLIEPGDFRTGFTANRFRTVASAENPAYAATFDRALAVMEEDERHGPPPAAVARLLARILAHPSPRLRYSTGPISQRMGVLLKRLLPGPIFEWLMMSAYKLH